MCISECFFDSSVSHFESRADFATNFDDKLSDCGNFRDWGLNVEATDYVYVGLDSGLAFNVAFFCSGMCCFWVDVLHAADKNTHFLLEFF